MGSRVEGDNQVEVGEAFEESRSRVKCIQVEVDIRAEEGNQAVGDSQAGEDNPVGVDSQVVVGNRAEEGSQAEADSLVEVDIRVEVGNLVVGDNLVEVDSQVEVGNRDMTYRGFVVASRVEIKKLNSELFWTTTLRAITVQGSHASNCCFSFLRIPSWSTRQAGIFWRLWKTVERFSADRNSTVRVQRAWNIFKNSALCGVQYNYDDIDEIAVVKIKSQPTHLIWLDLVL